MGRTITINPVTRIEGHAKVIVDLNDDNSVDFAGLVVNELRGFERILVGMEADRMPLVTGRICGVCPSAHHLAAVKALENGLGVQIPQSALLMRELFYMGHFIHSHAAHIFALAGPDLVFGVTGEAPNRNIVGIVEAQPEIAKKALRLRSLGQKINEKIGGRGVHPVTAVIGEMSFQLTEKMRVELDEMATEALNLIAELAPVVKELFLKQIDVAPELQDRLYQPTAYMGTVKDGQINFYDGNLRVIDEKGEIVKEFDVIEYEKHLVERALEWSYMKPVFVDVGGCEKTYRVNTLARLNLAESLDTPLAQKELEDYRTHFGRICHNTVFQVYARLIELIYSCEKAKELANNSNIIGESRVEVKVRAARGVGHVEAPRGTLIHDYEIDDKGIVRDANLIVATQQNFDPINRTIKSAIEAFVAASDDDKMLNAVEFAIRCYDPCLSCATHALGKMPLEINVRKNGRIVRTTRRER